MRHFGIVILIIISILASCNRHNDEKPYTYLEIIQELEPQSSVIDWGNMTSEERHQYTRKGFVINSVNEFPDDANVNLTDLKLGNIDFTHYTLLVEYALIPGYIQTHRLSWFYDNMEEEYVFQSSFRILNQEEDSDGMCTYYRAAILVNKIPSNSEVSFRYSY